MSFSNDISTDPIAERIRAEMERRDWSQRNLADRALLGEATVFRLLKGKYSRKTLRKVEAALGLELLDSLGGLAHLPSDVELADAEYGGYLRSLYDHYEAEYFLFRPSYVNPGQICFYPFDIEWSDGPSGLKFFDRNPGFEQSGMVSVASGTPFIHFPTQDQGSSRLITAHHMPPNLNIIRGVILSLGYQENRDLRPVSAPVILQKINEELQELLSDIGMIDRDDPRIRHIAGELTQSFAPQFL